MATSRRGFLAAVGATAWSLSIQGRPMTKDGQNSKTMPVIKPPRLKPGDKVGLISPASAAFEEEPIAIRTEALEALGLKVVLGGNHNNRYGYFAGKDSERAADINSFFADPEVKALIGRGGWGSSRLLPHLNYKAMIAHPKIVLGMSDVTALLLGIHARTGLVTFHGPPPVRDYSWQNFKRVVMDGEAVTMVNPSEKGENLAQLDDRIRVITPGKATGRLLGGNLTVLTAIVGSGYLPDWDGAILFLEDVNEAVYRVDRMLTQLKLAGILDRIAGFIFGRCTRCEPDSGYGSFTLEEVLDHHIGPLGVPAWQGAMIGHIHRQFNVPLGIRAQIDADKGVIQMLEPAVI